MAQKRPRNQNTSRFARYRPAIEAAIYVLALIGVLVVIHLWIQQGRGFDRGCLGFTTSAAIEASFDCEVVVESGAGTLFGISNALLGLLFYLAVAALTFLAGRRDAGNEIVLKQARTALVTVGLLYSAWLVYYQASAIGGYCALCLISAGVVLTLFVVHLIDLFGPATDARPADSSSMKKPASFYAGLAVATLVLAGADIAYFSSLEDAAPAPALASETAPVSERTSPEQEPVQGECVYDPERPPISNFSEFVSFSDPTRGNPEAPVTMLVYFDPNCPHCRTLDPIIEQVIEDHADDARFVFKPFPLWQHSVVQVHALYAAAQEGKFFEMMQRQFDLQRREGLSIDILKQIASDIGMNADGMETRINAGLYANMIRKDRQQAMDAGVRSMPTVVIDGRFVASSARSRDCLGTLIEEAGADT